MYEDHAERYLICICPTLMCLQVVEPKKAIVDVDVKKAEEAAAAANAIKTECEAALAEALPILVRCTQCCIFLDLDLQL